MTTDPSILLDAKNTMPAFYHRRDRNRAALFSLFGKYHWTRQGSDHNYPESYPNKLNTGVTDQITIPH